MYRREKDRYRDGQFEIIITLMLYIYLYNEIYTQRDREVDNGRETTYAGGNHGEAEHMGVGITHMLAQACCTACFPITTVADACSNV